MKRSTDYFTSALCKMLKKNNMTIYVELQLDKSQNDKCEVYLCKFKDYDNENKTFAILYFENYFNHLKIKYYNSTEYFVECPYVKDEIDNTISKLETYLKTKRNGSRF